MTRNNLVGKTILVVEDQFTILLDLKGALEEAGGELPKKLDAQTRRHTLVVRHEVEEFAKPEFLVTPQMPGLGKHSFDHALRLVPMSA